ncbi:cation transporter [Actinobacillus succinogenes]|uniref:Cation efflux protein n=1 Tax=Actinobacillus succinogenes (strain ATCC 55618 / DSM 22257 / CCUG 43843 / 130Z) TaxID=339671 RepID=A6VPH8_ACTSZ|nr:cation diffusion facilitator family transporter [Actinobacillus succinogenes]ABR74875.1 cation efflux protein [Actinobacillus succinogenes 130Z]PHI40715.1 cation transporter [Actinobacillus succinogenes]
MGYQHHCPEQGHHHGHSHNHIPQDRKILAWSFAVIAGYTVVEFIGGWLFNSLTLMADAGHMANDSLSLLLALIALFLSERKQQWFALLNAASLIVVAALILTEAVQRWRAPPEIQALPMLGVAVIGLLVNVLVAWIMLKSNRENLNVKAAYLHVLADLFGSVVAVVAGLSAYFLGWQWVDVAASAILSLFILRSGVGVMREVLANFN